MLKAVAATEGRLIGSVILAYQRSILRTSSGASAAYHARANDDRRSNKGSSRPPPLAPTSSSGPPREREGRRSVRIEKAAVNRASASGGRVPPPRDWTPSAKREGLARESGKAKAPAEPLRPLPPRPKQVKVKEVKREDITVPLPPFTAVNDLARVLNVKLRTLQATMMRIGHTDTRPDLLLPYSDAEILLLEYNASATPLSTSSNTFDIYPRPPAAASRLEERPPVIAIMGHVDHGKTTLLDKLRSASVAAGEAGGITQHVGAFSVPVKGSVRAITFLDTPGHAAFTKMRGRGAKVTDIVVLVVAADDGVMPQTREVIQMVKEVQEEEASGSGAGLQLVIALSKMDKAEANVEKVKSQLFTEEVQVEGYGGEVPCVEISGKTGEGLDKLQETLIAISELNELKAEKSGPSEGYVIESRVEKGLGNTAIVLIKRGALQVGDYIVAGLGWCKVRKLMDSSGKVAVPKASPGDAVLVTGWRDLPNAGDLLLGIEDSPSGEKAEELVKKCLDTRKRVEERRKLGQDVLMINESRRTEALERERLARKEFEDRQKARAERLERADSGLTEEELRIINETDGEAESSLTENKQADVKELRLVVRADYSGTVEAVVGAISGIGNNQVRVKIVSAGIGEPSEGDVAMAQAVGGQIIGFNVKASRSLQNAAQKASPSVSIHCDDVIYRLMSYVTDECVSLLPTIYQPRILGEATIQQVFNINIKGRVFRNVAGCRVTNGTISKNQPVRILRTQKTARGTDSDGERKVIFEGRLESLKQVKKEVDEMKRGTECGMAFANFQDFQRGDYVQSYHNEEMPKTL